MVKPEKFRTKTEFAPRLNGKLEGLWTIGLDIGYSSVKIYSPQLIGRFPSYARESRDISFIQPPKESIVYRDNVTGKTWLVGAVAQNTMSGSGVTDSETSLFGRERYFSPMFKVITETGLGIALLDGTCSYIARDTDEKIVVQTGLPEKYMDDSPYIKDVISGDHNFSLSIGGKKWLDFKFHIDTNNDGVCNVQVISQPKGTLFSVCIKEDGTWHENARNYLSSNVVVFDPGFGTLDIFPIMGGVVGEGETYETLGMKRVLQETSHEIEVRYNTKIPVPSMQMYLEKGVIPSYDRRTFSSEMHPFADILGDASKRVCDEALNTLADAVSLSKYSYMIVTGGTGAAWLSQIEERFKNLKTLTILHGNQNDNLPFVYSNVRGYYLFLLNMLGKSNH